ncbi:hypothetical protein GCM10023189_19300 [Nibrella saemangeumensis]|uniref:Uncharacterized protein n=1 Tax=Nibrella saemangeumensis TaxID=1084526 RepID=A0ABP8MRR2_9BACT
MNFDRFFIISSLLGDEFYKTHQNSNANPDLDALEKQFRLLYNQPIGDYMTSGLPTFMIKKKQYIKLR